MVVVDDDVGVWLCVRSDCEATGVERAGEGVKPRERPNPRPIPMPNPPRGMERGAPLCVFDGLSTFATVTLVCEGGVASPPAADTARGRESGAGDD